MANENKEHREKRDAQVAAPEASSEFKDQVIYVGRVTKVVKEGT